MFDTKKRNRKITHLIESVIRDHCRIYNTISESVDDGIVVHYNDEPLYYLGIEFSDSEFYIYFNGFVFSELSMSELIKLREIYKDDTITELLTTSDMELWFFEDKYLMAKRITTKEYKDYSILQTAFAIELFEQINNTVAIRNHFMGMLEEREGVLTN